MISVKAFSELLEVLYSAPLHQEQWQQFLTLVSQHTHSSSGFFLSTSEESRLRLLAAGGALATHPFIASYNAEHAQSDPFRGAAARRSRHWNPIGVYSEDDLIDPSDFLKTPLYQQLLAPINLRHAAITIVNLSIRRLDAVSLWRTPDEGPVTTECRELLELLLPHLRTAIEVTRRLRLDEQVLASTELMADASATATFIVDAHAHVHRCNAAAEAMLRTGDGLTYKGGKLAASIHKGQNALDRLLRECAAAYASSTSFRSNAAIAIARPSKKRALNLIAMPLPVQQRLLSGGDVLLLASDPEAPVQAPDVFLRDLFGFTSTEIEVANGLMIGYSSDEIACLRRVARGTVRQQIKGMLAKTGTNRQVDMFRLFLSLPTVPNAIA